MFWNFCGVSIVILSVSMFRATNFKLEAANQKLEVNRAVERVKKVSSGLENTVKTLPKPQQKKIQQEIEQVQYDLIEAQQKILSDKSGDRPTE